VNKILQDTTFDASVNASSYDYEAEKAVLAKLLEYPTVIRLSARDLEPHKVATYLYELAKELNRYYETTRIAESAPIEKKARIEVLQKVQHIFSHGLSMLGIEVPEKM
jgi:arginyl-tRNA synthetase